MDEPNLQLQKYLSHDRSAINYSQQTDRKLDELYDKQSGELDKKKRYAAAARVREASALERGVRRSRRSGGTASSSTTSS